jgi:hypothetical protein
MPLKEELRTELKKLCKTAVQQFCEIKIGQVIRRANEIIFFLEKRKHISHKAHISFNFSNLFSLAPNLIYTKH